MRGCVTRVPDFNREEEESGDEEEGVGVGVGGRMRGEGRVRYHDLYDGRHRRHNGHKGRREGSRGKRRNRSDGRRRGNQEEEDDDDIDGDVGDDENDDADEDDGEEDDDEGGEDEEDNVDGDDDEASTSDPALALASAPALPPLLAFGRLESMLVTPRIQHSLLRETQSLASSNGSKGYYRLPARVFTSSTLAQEVNEVNPSSLAVPQTSSSATATTTSAAATKSPLGAVKNIRQLQMMLIKHMLQPSTVKHTTSQETQVNPPTNT